MKLIFGDILDADSLPNDGQFTHILHAATESTNRGKLSPFERHDEIVNGTRTILEYAVKNKVSRFLLTSSGAVYGRNRPKWIVFQRAN